MNSATLGRIAAVDVMQGTCSPWLAPDVAIALSRGKDDDSRQLLGWLIRNPPTTYVEQQRAAASWVSRPAADVRMPRWLTTSNGQPPPHEGGKAHEQQGKITKFLSNT